MAVVYNDRMKIVMASVILGLAGLGVFQYFQNPPTVRNVDSQSAPATSYPSPSLSPEVKQPNQSQRVLFVPYWNPIVDPKTQDEYDTFVYFGVAVTEEGSIKSEEGSARIEDFQESTTGKKQLLTIRMLDTDINYAILEEDSRQDRMIEEIIPMLETYDFDGIVLDLELTALPLSDVQNNISLFIQRISKAMKDEDKHVAITLYGDVYYRARPYDVKVIGESVDEIMIMTYDFHKARGEAGPNFPLSGQEIYGYDLKAMIKDYTADVSASKLTILLGMYGYDWTLGPQGKPLKAARALPLRDIVAMTEPKCDLSDCKITRDPDTKETNVTYKDTDGYKHVLWFENDESVGEKINYLRDEGIESIGYWVYGYY